MEIVSPQFWWKDNRNVDDSAQKYEFGFFFISNKICILCPLLSMPVERFPDLCANVWNIFFLEVFFSLFIRIYLIFNTNNWICTTENNSELPFEGNQTRWPILNSERFRIKYYMTHMWRFCLWKSNQTHCAHECTGNDILSVVVPRKSFT